MIDLRRTILWSVFAFSLLMLWDGYLRHTGQPSMFSPGPAAADVAADAASAASAAVANGSAAVPLATAGAGALPPASASASAASGVSAPAVPPREQVLIETDTVRATLDTLGGNLVKLELLKHTDQDNTAKPVLLLEQSAVHTYLAQSGLVSATGALPDHTTPMTVLTSERKLADGQNTLVVKLESAVVGGVKRVLTYSFPRGGYVVDVKQEVVNTTAAAIKPQLAGKADMTEVSRLVKSRLGN